MDSVQECVKHIRLQIRTAKDLAILATTVGPEEECQWLDFEKSVVSVEKTAQRMKEYVRSEQALLERAQALEHVLKFQQERLCYTESRLSSIQLVPASKATPCSEISTTNQQFAATDSRTDLENLDPSSTGGHSGESLTLKQIVHVQPSKSGHVAKKSKEIPPILPLTDDEFAAVPQYMKGRLTKERVNQAIDEIKEMLAGKYAILFTPMPKLNEKDLAKYKIFKSQESNETRSAFFFSDHDLSAAKHIKLDATGKAILTVLRHAGRLRNARGAGATRYIVC